ncbi:uncharacterized protein LOC134701062 [Mytilus trossulus]|uniref:uncharacterized protein LOC134701062 n=1 Tax=Mytilus trossulus TaxID=6551 RepID=UPI0030063001
MDFIKCVPPKNVPRTNKSDVNTVHVIVVVGKITAYIGDLQYKEDDNQFSLIIGLLTGGLVTSIIIGFTAVFISRRSKKRFMVKCKMEMSKDLSERRENSGNNDELRRIEGNEMAYSEINPARQFDSHTNSISHQDVHNGYEKLGPCSPTNPYNWLQQSATDNQIADKEIGNNDELRRIEGIEMAYSEINPAAELNSNTNSKSHQDVHNEYEKLGPCSPTNPYNWLQQSATDNQIADKEIGNNDELRRIEGNEMAYSEINPAAELNSNINSKGHQDVHNEYEKLGPCSPTNPYNWLQQSATDNQIADKEIGNNDELKRIEGNEMAYSEINPAAELNSNTNSIGHQDVHNEYEKLGPCSPTNPYNWLQQSATDNQIADKEIGNNDELKRIEGNEMAYSEINPAAELNSNTHSIGHQDVHNEYEKLGPCSPTNPYNWLQQSATDNQMRNMINVDNCTVSACDYMNLKL